MVRVWRALLVSLWLGAGCAPAVGPLFTSADSGPASNTAAPADKSPDARAATAGSAQDASAPDAGAPDAAAADAGKSVVRPGMRLQYQLQGALDQTTDADLFVIDLFDTTSAAVAQLHARGRVVLAYISAGSYEPWRPDVSSLPASVVGEPLARYPEESWLDIRASSVRTMMEGRLTMAVDKGFDGALLVSLDGYLTKSGHDFSATDQLAYNVWLAQQAAARHLAAGISSDWPHAGKLASNYDFAIHLNCLADGSCADLTPFRERGHAVFDLETSHDTATVCARAAGLSLSVTLKNDNYDAWLAVCP